MATTPTALENIAESLRHYLGESLKEIRSWMNYYFSTAGLFALVLLVAAFQLERECGAISNGSLFQLPIDLPNDCLDSKDGKHEIKLFGAEIIRDFVSVVLGLAYSAFISILLLRIRSFSDILSQLHALSESCDRTEEVAYDIQYYPWPASPFRGGALGTTIFWGGLGLGISTIGLTGWIHVFEETGTLVIGETLYRSIGIANLLLFGFSLAVLFRISRHIRIIRSLSLRFREPRTPT